MNIEQILESYRKYRNKARVKQLTKFIRSPPEDQQVIHTSNKTLLRVGMKADQSMVDEIGRKLFIRQALRGQQMADMKPDTSKEGLKQGYRRFMERENAMHMVSDPIMDRKAVLAQLQSRLSKNG